MGKPSWELHEDYDGWIYVMLLTAKYWQAFPSYSGSKAIALRNLEAVLTAPRTYQVAASASGLPEKATQQQLLGRFFKDYARNCLNAKRWTQYRLSEEEPE